jgi:hypothetical protein
LSFDPGKAEDPVDTQIFGKGEPSGSPVQAFGGVLAEAAQCTSAHGGKRPARMHALGHQTQ